jgi:tripartite-type tricarboxylate transporter receptor subunit TctC
VPYDVEKDLTLIANTLRLSNMMIVNNSVPVRTIPELIAYAKKNPGKLAFGSDGNGTTAHQPRRATAIQGAGGGNRAQHA